MTDTERELFFGLLSFVAQRQNWAATDNRAAQVVMQLADGLYLHGAVQGVGGNPLVTMAAHEGKVALLAAVAGNLLLHTGPGPDLPQGTTAPLKVDGTF